MPIIKWEPSMTLLEEMQNMLSDFSNTHMQGFSPALDVYQDEKNVYVEVPLAGVDLKNVKISIENNILTLQGVTKKESEVDDKNFYRKEIGEGSFFRTVALPTHVKWDKAEATSKDGMLKIVIPKAPGAKTKSIAIKIRKS